MQLFLDAVGVRHPACRIIMGLDGAGGLAGALNPPHNMKRLTLPPYAPELHPVEPLWHESREKFFHPPSPSILLMRWKRAANQPACPRNRFTAGPVYRRMGLDYYCSKELEME